MRAGLFPLRTCSRKVTTIKHNQKELRQTSRSLTRPIFWAPKYTVAYKANNASIRYCKFCDPKITMFLTVTHQIWNKKFSLLCEMPTHGYLPSHTFSVYRSPQQMCSYLQSFMFCSLPSQTADLSWRSHRASNESPKHQLLHVSNGLRWTGAQRQTQPLDQPVLDLH